MACGQAPTWEKISALAVGSSSRMALISRSSARSFDSDVITAVSSPPWSPADDVLALDPAAAATAGVTPCAMKSNN